jgi:hypothetical protein
MQKRFMGISCLLFLLCGLAVMPSFAQMAQGKPDVYTYVAEWSVPRAQWGDMVKADDADKPVLDKLVADGTLVGYGAYTNILHVEGEPTHGTWFTATSEGNLLKGLEAIYAQPGLTTSPVQGASKHWDLILTGNIYGGKPVKASDGYLTISRWQVKPGMMHDYVELSKKAIVPLLDKLVADGTLTSYGQLREDYHTQGLGTVWEYFTVPDAASMDKVDKALEAAFESNPALGDAIRGAVEHDGHRDYINRIRYMVAK